MKIPVQDREAYAKLPENKWSAIGDKEQTWVTHTSGRRLELNRIRLPEPPFQCVVDRSETRLCLLPNVGGLWVYSIPEGEECTVPYPDLPTEVLSFGLPEGNPYSAVTWDGYSYYFDGPRVKAFYTTSTLASPAHRAVSANGQFIADFEEGELSRLNVRVLPITEAEEDSFRSPGVPKAFAVRNDGAVAIANEYGTIFMWTERRPRVVGRRVLDIVGERTEVDELCWLGNSDELFVLPVEGHPMVLDVSKRRFVGEIVIDFPVNEMIAYHPGRDTLLIGGGDRTLREYSRDLKPLGSMEFPGEPLILARPYEETRVLALSNYDHIVHAIDLDTWTVLWECDMLNAIDLRIDEDRGSFIVRCWSWTEERSLDDGRMLFRLVFYKGGAWLREAEDGRFTCSPGLDLAVRLAGGRMVRTPSLVSNSEPK